MSEEKKGVKTYRDFEAKVLERLEEMKGSDLSAHFSLQVAGDVTALGGTEIASGIRRETSTSNSQINEQQHGNYSAAVEWTRTLLQQLTGPNIETRFSMKIINLSTGEGLKAQWTWNRGSIINTKQNPRTQRASSARGKH